MKTDVITTSDHSTKKNSAILLKTFLYFAVFKFPLTKEEALRFCQYKTDSIDKELAYLLKEKRLFKFETFYLPQRNIDWVHRRINGKELSEKMLPKAKKMANLLQHFPFVRSIMISGTLAKGYMDDDADIDFFVITKPGNITISKLLIGLTRRIFSPKSLCVNFIIDTDHLLIEKQNIYAATELATLIPLIDSGIFNRFSLINKKWMLNSLPNSNTRKNNAKVMNNSGFKRLLESIFSGKIAGEFEKILQTFYLKKLGTGNAVFENSLKSGELKIKPGVFKGHNLAYEKTILDLYYENQHVSKSNQKIKNFFYD